MKYCMSIGSVPKKMFGLSIVKMTVPAFCFSTIEDNPMKSKSIVIDGIKNKEDASYHSFFVDKQSIIKLRDFLNKTLEGN